MRPTNANEEGGGRGAPSRRSYSYSSSPGKYFDQPHYQINLYPIYCIPLMQKFFLLWNGEKFSFIVDFMLWSNAGIVMFQLLVGERVCGDSDELWRWRRDQPMELWNCQSGQFSKSRFFCSRYWRPLPFSVFYKGC